MTSDVQAAGEADVDAAVAAARAAFKGSWKKFSGAQRAACMNKLADLIETNLEKLSKLETIAMGQPIAVGKVFTGLTPPGWRCMFYLLSLKQRSLNVTQTMPALLIKLVERCFRKTGTVHTSLSATSL